MGGKGLSDKTLETLAKDEEVTTSLDLLRKNLDLLRLTNEQFAKENNNLKKLLNEKEVHIKHQHEELIHFKEITANLKNDFDIELDTIVPEDLELALSKFESVECSTTIYPDELAAISDLCQKLGFEVKGHLPLYQQIKIFIKTLARNKTALHIQNKALLAKLNKFIK